MMVDSDSDYHLVAWLVAAMLSSNHTHSVKTTPTPAK